MFCSVQMESRDPNKLRRSTTGRPPRQVVYERLNVQIGELRERMGGLPSPLEAQGIWRGIWLEEAHHSTAIEGNTLVLRQVERLLDEGLAVGNKELKEYMEVRGYANAADWVYVQGVDPGEWSDASSPITLTEVRHVHKLALDLVWDVAPHPEATPSEAPGSFREHDIQPSPRGDAPAPLDRGARGDERLDRDDGAPETRSAAPLSRGAGRGARALRADPPFPRRERTHGTASSQSAPRPPGLSAGHHLQARPVAVPPRAATSRQRRLRHARRDVGARDARQPVPVHRPRGSRTEPTRSVAGPGVR